MEEGNEYTVTERVGKVVWWLAKGEGLALCNVCSLTGMSESGAWKMLASLSRVIPIFADDEGVWQACELKEIL